MVVESEVNSSLLACFFRVPDISVSPVVFAISASFFNSLRSSSAIAVPLLL
jgi:hypothetical protein